MWRPSILKKRSESPLSFTKDRTLSADAVKRPSIPRRPTANPPRSTLVEAVRYNAFRLSSKDASQIAEEVKNDPIQLLNADLHTLATIYPDVQLDVLRELLLRFDGNSRLQVCVEQLFRYKAEWARGRLISPPRDIDDELPKEDLFRNTDYTESCKQILYIEFKGLNRSAVDAVLAEANSSYTKARPILQEISARSWRATLTGFFKKKKGAQEAPSFLVETMRNASKRLVSTDNQELDQELDLLFFASLRNEAIAQQTCTDFQLATTINTKQAEEVGALYECQCCYDDVPFEQITTCTTEGHVFCVGCVRRTFNEALFGQSWNRSINPSRCTLHCFAPSTNEVCEGHIPALHLRHLIRTTKSGDEIWSKFEQRLITESLTRSNLPLQTCSFCTYAEALVTHDMISASAIQWTFRCDRATAGVASIVFLYFFKFLLPILLLLTVSILMILPSSFKQSFRQALIKVTSKSRSQRFKCRSPSCGKKSCTSCHKQWHDPHVCHEPLVISLRTAVEAARTSALKRVCPRCGMGFVKDSGCNKLICVCGYAMCYLCRKNIGKATSSQVAIMNRNVQDQAGPDQPQAAEQDNEIAMVGEGYRHFCPHFRAIPGQKCTECDKCDLYKTEDEEAVVRRAGEIAEREWRAQHEDEVDQAGEKIDSKSLDKALVGINDEPRWLWDRHFQSTMRKAWRSLRQGKWSVQACMDWVVEQTIVIIDDGL